MVEFAVALGVVLFVKCTSFRVPVVNANTFAMEKHSHGRQASTVCPDGTSGSNGEVLHVATGMAFPLERRPFHQKQSKNIAPHSNHFSWKIKASFLIKSFIMGLMSLVPCVCDRMG